MIVVLAQFPLDVTVLVDTGASPGVYWGYGGYGPHGDLEGRVPGPFTRSWCQISLVLFAA